MLQHGSTPLGRHGWSRYALGEDGVPLPVAWARSGFVVVAVDALGFGSREGPDDRGRLRRGRPDLLFRTRDQRMQAVQDLMRTVDYLESRADVRSDAIALAGVSMGCRVGVPCFALDERLRAAAFFVAGAGPYSRFDISEGDPLHADEAFVEELTGPARFAPLTAGRPVYLANGRRDELVGSEAAERLRGLLGEPKTLRWFDGGHGETPPEIFEEARSFLASQLVA